MTAIYVIFVISLVLVAALHAVCAFFRGRIARLSVYSNILLHLVILLLLLLMKLGLDAVALVFTLSLLCYLSFSCIALKRSQRAKGKEEQDDL